MALKLGKKNTAESTVVTDDTTALPSEDQFADLIPDNLPPKRRGANPAVLGGGALALAALAVGGWWMFGRQSVDETETAPPPPARVATNANSVADDAPVTKPVTAIKPATGTKPAIKAAPVAKRPMTRPEKAGIVPPKAVAGKPVIAAPKPGALPRFVPVQGVPTPVPLIRPGMAGQPGRRNDRRQVLVVSPNIAAKGASLQAQLDDLWKAGAAAKHRGDVQGARNQWQRILELSPNHPGIQDAIDKLNA